MPAHSLTAEQVGNLEAAYAKCGTVVGAAKACGVSRTTAAKYLSGKRDTSTVADWFPPWLDGNGGKSGRFVTSRGQDSLQADLPQPVDGAGGALPPDPSVAAYDTFHIDTPGRWGVLSDVHIPEHDNRTLETFARKCAGAKGILLNGDILECATVSRHKNAVTYTLEDELTKAEQFLVWLRSRFPRARIVFREGNHEDMFPRYLIRNAPDLRGVRNITIPSLLNLAKYGVEWVAEKRIVTLGKLLTLHGHEYAGSGGKTPAKWLLDRTYRSALCSHFHKADKFAHKDATGKLHIGWVTGCARWLHPDWFRLNQWSHGFAEVEVANDGRFHVENWELLRDGTLTGGGK